MMQGILGNLLIFMWIQENCIFLGGKLLELETAEENEFIKDTVRTLNTGGTSILKYKYKNTYDVYVSKTAHHA